MKGRGRRTRGMTLTRNIRIAFSSIFLKLVGDEWIDKLLLLPAFSCWCCCWFEDVVSGISIVMSSSDAGGGSAVATWGLKTTNSISSCCCCGSSGGGGRSVTTGTALAARGSSCHVLKKSKTRTTTLTAIRTDSVHRMVSPWLGWKAQRTGIIALIKAHLTARATTKLSPMSQ